MQTPTITEADVVEKVDTDAVVATAAEGVVASPESSGTAAGCSVCVGPSTSSHQVSELVTPTVLKNEEPFESGTTNGSGIKPTTSGASHSTDSSEVRSIVIIFGA